MWSVTLRVTSMAQRLLTVVSSMFYKVNHDIFRTLTTASIQIFTYIHRVIVLQVFIQWYIRIQLSKFELHTSATRQEQAKFITHHVVKRSKYGMENNYILTVTTMLVSLLPNSTLVSMLWKITIPVITYDEFF